MELPSAGPRFGTLKWSTFWSVSPLVMPKIPQNFPPAAGQNLTRPKIWSRETEGGHGSRGGCHGAGYRLISVQNSVLSEWIPSLHSYSAVVGGFWQTSESSDLKIRKQFHKPPEICKQSFQCWVVSFQDANFQLVSEQMLVGQSVVYNIYPSSCRVLWGSDLAISNHTERQ